MKYLKIVIAVILVGLVMSLVANPLEEPAAVSGVKVLKVEYEADLEGITVWLEGMSDRWRPVIPVSDFTTEAEFQALVSESVQKYYDSLNTPPPEPIEPVDKINEAKKLVGKEIDI